VVFTRVYQINHQDPPASAFDSEGSLKKSSRRGDAGESARLILLRCRAGQLPLWSRPPDEAASGSDDAQSSGELWFVPQDGGVPTGPGDGIIDDQVSLG